MLNDKYYKNREIEHDGYKLQITTGLTVYHDSNRGFVKLDSFYNPRIGKLSVVLPNEKTIMIIGTKEGLKVESKK